MRNVTTPAGKSRGLVVASLAAAGLLSAFLCSSLFVFFPIGFRNDAIMDLPWHWYREPLTVEYWVTGHTRVLAIADSREAFLVLTEARKGLPYATPVDMEAPYHPNIIVNVKRASDGFLLLTMDGESMDKTFTAQDAVQVPLSNTLRELLQRRLRGLSK